MCNIIIFGGTTEGRLLSEYAAGRKLHVYVSVTTDYGEKLLPKSEYLHVLKNKMNAEDMQTFFKANKIEMVIDATHPFATEVTENIKTASDSIGIKRYRVVRRKGDEPTDSVKWFDSLEDILEYLNEHEGNVFVTTGSKEIKEIARIRNAHERCVLRVLDVQKIVNECTAMGFEWQRIIAKRGPFSLEENLEDFGRFDCKYLVTKDSGDEGGFLSKLEAAGTLEMISLVLKRPKEEGIELGEMMKILNYIDKKVVIVGIGMDGKDTITVKGREVIEGSELIIGARRMIESVDTEGKEVFVSYNSEEIAESIRNTDKKKIAVLMSGDCGFYSGCRGLTDKLSDIDISIVSGISSAVYFAGLIKQSWQDMNFVSLHGVNANIVSEVKSHRKTFFLLGGEISAGDVCKRLVKYQYGRVKVSIGENLGSDTERVVFGTAEELVDISVEKLSVMLVENHMPIENPAFGINDELFIRGGVPMTKSEVRAVAMSRLKIGKSDICWDIGCGTGSVSVEMADFATKGVVYAVDKKHEAIELTKENAYQFGCDNIITVERDIKKGLGDLPAPDVVFIGGSSGGLEEVLGTAIHKNSKCRIVITAVSVETLALANRMMKQYGLHFDITQISAARTGVVGEHTMFKGENPIFLIVGYGK